MLSALRVKNFRILWIGQCVSLLGDQFYLIALPWLVLQLTGDSFAMGTVLAMAGIPRAFFILFGGALVDRFSPRNMMLASNMARGTLVAILAFLVLSGLIQLWMLYVFAFSFGLVDSFYFPASGSIVPQIVEKEQLQAANSLMQGVIQLSLFLGPVLAGLLIAIFDTSTRDAASVGLLGIGIAFAFDAFTFAVSALTLWFVRIKRKFAVAERENVLESVKVGLAYMWQDVSLRTWFLIIAGINLFFNGPFMVGIPVLADTRFPEGAAAFGIVISGFGIGSLTGTILAGVLPKPKPAIMGTIILLVIASEGVNLALIGFVSNTYLAAFLAYLIGAAQGYIVILWITWLQSTTPAYMLGRVWSMVMFSSIGIQPISQSLAGALLNYDITFVFLVSGILLSAMCILAAFNRDVRAMNMVELPDISVEDAIRKTGEIPILSKHSTGEFPMILSD